MDNLYSDDLHDFYSSPKIFGRSNQEGRGERLLLQEGRKMEINAEGIVEEIPEGNRTPGRIKRR